MEQPLIIISFIVAFLTAYPVWYHTTAVHRAHIPFDDIDSLNDLQLTFECLVMVHLVTKVKSRIDPESLSRELQLSQSNTLRKAAAAISDGAHGAMVQLNITYKAQYTTEDVITAKSPNDSNYHIYILMDHTEANSSAAWHLEFGVGRSLTLRPFVQFTHDQLGRLLNSVLATVFSQELHEISSLATIKSNEPSIMRVVKYSPEFSISFNLMNGASEDLITDWAIDDAVKEWMTPLLNRIPSKFHYYTQTSQYSPLSISVGLNTQAGEYLVSHDSLPHLFNVGEWNLDSPVSNSTEIHFAVFIPPRSQSPLKILGENGDSVFPNAVLIPRWGGICIVNTQKDLQSNRTEIIELTRADLEPVFEVFVQQLRLLIGVEQVWPVNQLSSAAQKPELQTYDLFVQQHCGREGLTEWEMDKFLRRRTVELASNTANTLLALSRLLRAMPNMPVSDSIKRQVREALSDLNQAQRSLSNQDLNGAFSYCRRATYMADKAFFDPSMTAMQYFPDEHLYAVYAPLFFPVAVPILVSIFRLMRAAK